MRARVNCEYDLACACQCIRLQTRAYDKGGRARGEWHGVAPLVVVGTGDGRSGSQQQVQPLGVPGLDHIAQLARRLGLAPVQLQARRGEREFFQKSFSRGTNAYALEGNETALKARCINLVRPLSPSPKATFNSFLIRGLITERSLSLSLPLARARALSCAASRLFRVCEGRAGGAPCRPPHVAAWRTRAS
eukprot:326570-Pleurochrysis_carterae.AAC.3